MKRINIEGMQCRNCSACVEEALCRMEAVEDVRVSLEEGYADVIGAISDEDLIDAITHLGYTVTSIE